MHIVELLTQADVDEVCGAPDEKEGGEARTSSEDLDDEDGSGAANEFDGARDEEVEVVIASEVARVVGQAIVHHRVHKPVENEVLNGSLFLSVFFLFALYRVAISVCIYNITRGYSLQRGLVDGVNSDMKYTTIHPTHSIECDKFFKVQMICLSFTWDINVMSRPRDEMFSTALPCVF